MNNNLLISFHNICVKKNNEDVLKHVNFVLNKGEFLSIYGNNGSGKTTIYKVIAGTVEYSGDYKLYDKPIDWYTENDLEIVNQKIGLMPAILSFDENLNVLQNMQIISSEMEMSPLEALEICNAEDLLNRNILYLNGLERIKVYLAGLMMKNPELLILDEPSGNLDKIREKEVYDILHNIYNRGVTILLLTKKKDFLSMSTRIMHMDDGRLS